MYMCVSFCDSHISKNGEKICFQIVVIKEVMRQTETDKKSLSQLFFKDVAGTKSKINIFFKKLSNFSLLTFNMLFLYDLQSKTGFK